MPQTDKMGDKCHDFIINHQIDPIIDGEYQIPRRQPMNQRPFRFQNKSRSKSRGRKFATQNFFNQTMTQIVQGKNREIQPLVGGRRQMYQAQDYSPQELIAPIDQYYNTPKKQGQFAYGDELMNT
jgi:hypothetical protein